MAAAVDLVDDVDDAGGPVKQDASGGAAPASRPKAAIVLGGPVGDITVIDDLRLQGVPVTVPDADGRPRSNLTVWQIGSRVERGCPRPP